MRTLLVSDLHLEDQRPDITRAFFCLLDTFQGNVDRLFILGDFFELWLGDDIVSDTARRVAQRMRSFSNDGCDIFIMHGNRDFLLGNEYASQCGAQLIGEPYPTSLAGEDCVLMHGDSLCIDDTEYQAFRKMVRNPAWQQQFLAKSPQERIAFGRQARNQSQEDQKQKSKDILDVNDDAVRDLFKQENVPLLVHGHTHRPAMHNLQLEGVPKKRVVLGDWDKQGWYLLATDDSLQLDVFPLPAAPESS